MTVDPWSLEGKCALLTGALGILGSQYCETLADAGASLVLVDLDADACAGRATELSRRGRAPCHGIAADVGNEDSVASLSATLADLQIRPDVLINNAAAKSPNFFTPLDTFPRADWDAVMQTNVTGAFLMLRAFLPGMVAQGGGVIVNVGSLYGIRGPDQRIYDGAEYPEMGGAINTPLVYSASKGALSAMTRHIATTYGAQGIRANTLVPGGVASGQNDVFQKNYAARVPMGRMASHGDMASALLFLCSDASAYVNGQDLVVDGGVTAW